MRLLIDGYNLLYQSDLVGKGRGPRWLEKARGRLIKAIDSHLPPSFHHRTLIVFDAKSKGLGSADEVDNAISFGGVDISYATAYAEADDYLEKLIREHPTPKKLLVVSSDLRIQRCAAACRANFEDSYSWYLWLQRQPPSNSTVADPSPSALEQPTLTDAEVNYWLKEFDKPSENKRIKKSPDEKFLSNQANPKEPEKTIKSEKVAKSTRKGDSATDKTLANGKTSNSSMKAKKSIPANSQSNDIEKPKTTSSPPKAPRKVSKKKNSPADHQRAKRKLPPGEGLFPPGYADDLDGE